MEFANAICYSGYRENQSPADHTYPSYEQVCEDLRILEHQWTYLRVYDCTRHAELVLKAIRNEGLDFRVMLGANMRAEVSNPGCPWGADFSEDQLAENRKENSDEIDRMIQMAIDYRDEVCAVSVGNEATVEWTDHMVPVDRLIDFVRRIRRRVDVPITFCENYVPWVGKLEPLAMELDFLSVHTYPVWEYRNIDSAMDYSIQNYRHVADHYPETPVIITEAGWTTNSNGRGIDPWNAAEEFQAVYCSQLLEWSRAEGVLTFLFEAFDEPWKGSPDPMEPEKHWGLFTVDRQPKQMMRGHLARL
ncbi:MAG: glycosyl hydrolase [Acidimicrobiia bacterium]|nr:glycosyl hydrolase [Acidimicrobiia bacterium]